MPRPLRVRAREAFAESVEAQGPAWRNAADSVRGGFENCWITAALDALERALRSIPDDHDDDDP